MGNLISDVFSGYSHDDSCDGTHDDSRDKLPSDIWATIVEKVHYVAEPNTKDNTVYTLWLMQVNKEFSKLVRAYFVKKGIKSFDFSMYDGGRLGKRVYKYGVVVKDIQSMPGVECCIYTAIHNRKVITITFSFCGRNNTGPACNRIHFIGSIYRYTFELKDVFTNGAR